MAISIDFNESTLLDSLSSFWTQLFADRDQLKAAYVATEEGLGQAYQELLLSVIRLSIGDIPLFRPEYWTQLLLRRDRVTFTPGAAFPYSHDAPDSLAAAQLIFNTITAPSLAWELGLDFELDVVAGTLRFREDPFGSFGERLATRSLDIAPTAYSSGTRGSYDTGGVNPNRLTVSGRVQDGLDGASPGTDVFQALSGDFLPEHVGHTITVAVLGGVLRTVVAVIDRATVRLDAPVGAVAAGAAWQLIDEDVFNAYHVGDQVQISDPAAAGSTQLLTIASVVTVGVSTRTVDFTRDINLPTVTTQSARWTHQSPTTTTQRAAWLPDAGFDRDDLYYAFGCLVNRRERSSEGYRALLQGIFQLYMLGPARDRIEAALNTFVGVPVSHLDGEVVLSVDTLQPDAEIVETDYGVYELPKGSLAPRVVVGYVFHAFEALTILFDVQDSVSDPQWFHGKEIPTDLIVDSSVPDRNVDPSLYEMVVGAAKPWYVGGPRMIVGADDDGQVVPVRAAGDGFLDTGGPTRFLPYQKSFILEDVGSTITIEGVDYTIGAVGLDSTFQGHTYADVGVDLLPIIATLAANGDIAYTGHPIFQLPGGNLAFSSVDVGRYLYVTTSSDGAFANTAWEITDVISATLARVAPRTPGFSGAYVAGTTMTMVLGLRWELKTRAPMRHNIGYNLMRDYLKTHILYVQYDLAAYGGVPSLRSDADIRQVILATKPAHTYLYLEGTLHTTDKVYVTDDLSWIIRPEQIFVQEDHILTVGSGWNVGDAYYYTGPQTAWIDVAIRGSGFAAGVFPFPGAAGADHLVLAADIIGDPTAIMTVTLYHDLGAGWVPTGTVVVIDPSVSAVASVPVFGAVMGASAVVSGAPTDARLIYGLNTNEPDLLKISQSNALTSSAASSPGGDTLVDLTFAFAPYDVYRDLEIEVGGVPTRFRIRSIVSGTSVKLWDANNTPASLPASAGIPWRLGIPRQLATPVVVGGAGVDVRRSGSSYASHVVDWPMTVSWQP